LIPQQRAVVVDTNVFGAALTRRHSPLVELYAPHLTGRVLVLAAQTVAELRFGALWAKWGPARRAELEQRITRARVAPVDEDLVWEVARLRVACRRAGHALADDHHTGDLWIAATAVRYHVPLVAHDGVFRNTPGLDLRTELSSPR
jgi:predicted nucleic acid-binding protein